jgi:hypothetical protein
MKRAELEKNLISLARSSETDGLSLENAVILSCSVEFEIGESG